MKIASTILVAIIGAVVANLVLLFSLRPLVINPAMPLPILNAAPVTIFTVGGVLATTIVYALIRQVLAQPNKPFVVFSVVVLILSFIPDCRIIGNAAC
jgi:protein-S-isoprenylcysteine O-methyltransferase Ste14